MNENNSQFIYHNAKLSIKLLIKLFLLPYICNNCKSAFVIQNYQYFLYIIYFYILFAA